MLCSFIHFVASAIATLLTCFVTPLIPGTSLEDVIWIRCFVDSGRCGKMRQ